MTDEEREAMIQQTVKNVNAACAAINETVLKFQFQDVEFQKKGYKVKDGLRLIKGGKL